MKAALVALASVLVLAVSADAFAANACVAAADKGQDLRAAGKLDEARAQFLVCAKATCNRVVRADCERWVKEIDEEKSQAEEKERQEKKEREKEKEKERDREKPAASLAVSTVRVPIAVDDPSSSSSTSAATAPTAAFPVAPVVLGGLGVLSLAAFGYFQVQGWSRYASLEDGCAKTQSCTDADIEATRSQFVSSGAALGVSVVSFGVAAILYFTRSPDAAPSRLGVRPGGAAVSF
jgi:hypothetical protein